MCRSQPSSIVLLHKIRLSIRIVIINELAVLLCELLAGCQSYTRRNGCLMRTDRCSRTSTSLFSGERVTRVDPFGVDIDWLVEL